MNGCLNDTERMLHLIIKESNGEFDAKKILGNLMMDITAKCFFGIDINAQFSENSDFIKYAKRVLSFTFQDYRFIFISKLLLSVQYLYRGAVFSAMFPNLARIIENISGYEFFDGECNEFFKNIIEKAIETKRAEPSENMTCWQVYWIALTKKWQISMKCSTKEELEGLIISQLFVFIIAAFDPTSSTLLYCLYNLAMHPAIQLQAYKEIVNIIGGKEVIEYDDLSSMNYLNQVINETLRMYPQAPRLLRECNKDIEIGGIYFEKGSALLVPIFAIHYNNDYYPDPEKFDPERFSPENIVHRDPLAWLPFGFGPRICIGQRLATTTTRLILARLLRDFHFIPCDKTPRLPLRINTAGFTTPVNPIILSVERR
ncbi:unnamed protein product [Dracunculus medinensis]|uniref:Cytochrome P450 n=1 Tax=Dracunculus medinensis TaxID=318479 RepID=A0A0N4UBV0_DRAME|nr:unnamed protein product [Dracunculus medinensis]